MIHVEAQRKTIAMTRFRAAVSYIVLLTVACQRDEPLNTAPKGHGARTVVTNVVGSRHFRPDEQRFVTVGREVPGFAGFYRDPATNDFVVWVADSGSSAVAQSVIARHLATADLGLPRGYHPTRIVIRKGDYAFQQLSDWRDIVTDSVLGSLGVVFDDLDEMINRVRIGVPTGRQAEVLARLRSYGIPDAAVVFENVSEIRRTTGRASTMYVGDLNYVADSLTGGISVGSPVHPCTLGFVTRPVSGTSFAVTVSHCTTDFWSLDGDTFHQPSSVSSRTIGYESLDPMPASCAWWEGCHDKRNSDAILIALYSSDTLKPGFLPRPAQRRNGSAGTTNIDTGNPWLTIASTGSPAAGWPIDKVGVVTGWTTGYVTNTCIDGWNGTAYHKVMCQGRASTWIDYGDSGSPVFYYDGLDGVELWGMEWGTPCSSGPPCNDMLFSPFSQITYDLGNMDPTTNITVGVPSISGSLSGSPTISWSAVATTNTTAATSYRIYRSVWDASTYTWLEDSHYLGSTTSTSYTDNTVPVGLSAYNGTTLPAQCVYTYVSYIVVAYNSGIGRESNYIYFRGDANGPTPGQIQCP